MEENREEIEGHEEGVKKLNIKWFLLLIPVLMISLIMGHQNRQADTKEALFLYENFREDPAIDKSGTFLIYDAIDYLRFCSYINRGTEASDGALKLNAALMADVDLGSQKSYAAPPSADSDYIRYSMTEYSGTFEGNDHVLKGFQSVGSQESFVLRLNQDAIIRNLHLEDMNVVDDKYSAGGFCKYNYGLIENCSISGLVQSSFWAGGFASLNSGTIKDCVNKAQVISTNEADFFGAGGIAGKNERGEKSLDNTEDPVIVTSSNLGEVKGVGLAGGICASSKGASISNCGNEGSVTVEKQRLEPSSSIYYDALAAGICGDLKRGTIESCYNTGTISILEEGTCDTFGIAGNMFGITSRVRNCVSLEGTAKGSMRHESIMEVSKAELEQWKTGDFAYISNNWQFDLEEAQEKFFLKPLEIQESELSVKKKNIYLCDEFYLCAPVGFEITSPSPYALCIQPETGKALEQPDIAGYQVWLLRLGDEAEVSQFLNKEGLTEEKDTILEVFRKITGSHYLLPSNLASFSDQKVDQFINGTFLTKYRDGSLRFYLEEGEHNIDNIISLPLSQTEEEGYRVKWLLLFTDKNSNYRPENFYQKILTGFHYPPYVIKVKPGDTMSHLAAAYTGNGERWRDFMTVNQVGNANQIEIGQELKIPEAWLMGQ